jgi:hypothetical protein
LLTSNEGSIEWDCLMPRARAQIILRQEGAVEGFGYVERLDLTLRPWQLPIRELRWGRFLSDQTGVVWIEWRGPRPLVLLSVNGSEMDRAKVEDTVVKWGGSRLELAPGSVLREGPLGRYALARVPLLTLLAPRAIREIHESKQLRRGVLVGENGSSETGWVIDEVVRFGGPGE